MLLPQNIMGYQAALRADQHQDHGSRSHVSIRQTQTEDLQRAECCAWPGHHAERLASYGDVSGDRIKQAHVKWAWSPPGKSCGRMEMRRTFPHRLKVGRWLLVPLSRQSTALTGTDCVPSGKRQGPSSKELAGPCQACGHSSHRDDEA